MLAGCSSTPETPEKLPVPMPRKSCEWDFKNRKKKKAMM
jgi:hypothetical protein